MKIRIMQTNALRALLHGRHFATRRAEMDEIVDWLGFYKCVSYCPTSLCG